MRHPIYQKLLWWILTAPIRAASSQMHHFPNFRKFFLAYCEFVNSRIPAVISPLQDSRLRVLAQVLTLLVALVSGGVLYLLMPRMAPIQRGSAVQFWRAAAGVRLQEQDDETWLGHAHLIGNVWGIYEITHWHGSELYSAPPQEVMPYFDKVVELLRKDHEQGKDTLFVRGYLKWCKIHFQQRDAEALVQSIHIEWQEKWAAQGSDMLAVHLMGEELFRKRLRQSDWYWACVVFEWTLFTGLAWFAMSPILRRRSPMRLAFQTALVPTLFMMPTYLGYATAAFTSAGPRGGVLYPFLLRFVRGGSTSQSDQWLLVHLPQILEPLSPSIGQPAVLSFLGIPGPTSTLKTGVVLGLAVLGLSVWIRGANFRNAPLNCLKSSANRATADQCPTSETSTASCNAEDT